MVTNLEECRREGMARGIVNGINVGKTDVFQRVVERKLGDIYSFAEWTTHIRMVRHERMDAWLDADDFDSIMKDEIDVDYSSFDLRASYWPERDAWRSRQNEDEHPTIAAMRERAFNKGWSVGWDEGMLQGIADAFLRMARTKFGEPSPLRVMQVRAASTEELYTWVQALLEARDFDTIFKDVDDEDRLEAEYRAVERQDYTDWPFRATPALAWSEKEHPIMEKVLNGRRDEGRSIGVLEGKADAFLRLANRRFGEVPAARFAQIQVATSDELDIWLDAILDAPSIDTVFSGAARA